MFVIAGVSGNTGSVVADALLARGREVRVIVRDASKGEPWRAKGAEVAVAALEDEDALARALEGADGAYLLSPPSMASGAFLAERRALLETVGRAVTRAKVPHVVFLSSIGAQHAGGNGVIASVHFGERRLAETPAKTTFVRAAYFLENWGAALGAVAQGKLPTFIPADQAIPMVATVDIGGAAAAALLEPPTGKSQIIELAGPRDYAPRDIAAIVSKIVGQPVAAEAAPLEAVVPAFTSFGISADVAELFRQMYAGIVDGTVAYEGKGARHVRGATDAEAVLRRLLGR